LHGQPVNFDQQVRRISWRDILAASADLADEQRLLTSGVEQLILTDFLGFVDTHFPRLGPFSKLGRCKAEPSRVRRRLSAILSEVLGSDGVSLPGTHTSVATAYLEYENRRVELRMYPADTLQQARVFYDRPNIVEKVLVLKHEGWNVLPNFHFGFMAKGFDWTETSMPLAEYLRYWQQNIRNTAQVERQDWNEYWDKLVKAQIAALADHKKFDRDFTDTDRQTASPRPGIYCMFNWDLDEAERLDTRDELTKAVKGRINQLLEALGEDKI
jgi:hypothetical protein